MKRYAVCYILSILLHGLLLIPLWMHPELGEPTIGGGAGGSITISIAPVPEAEEGDVVLPTQQASRGIKGFDKAMSTRAGIGRGESAGPGIGVGSSEEGWDDILARIRSRIERAKRYPLMARRHGLEGTSDVTFQIQEDGTISRLTLTRSSGAAPLDAAALATIRRAAPFPFYPDPIQIGIRFALREKSD